MLAIAPRALSHAQHRPNASADRLQWPRPAKSQSHPQRRRRTPAAAAASSGPVLQPPGKRRPLALAGQIDFTPGTLLGTRYEVVELLGRGANGVTYRCKDTEGGGGDVAVKCLSLRSLKDWKQLELFEREAQTLKSLEHRGIPRYLDYFEQDTDQDRAFFLVQEEAQGKSLEDMVRSGWRADEAEVTRIGCELLEVLQYLGSRRPPVIHRDVKPENIVIEGGKTGGRVFLVDFGGVQAAAAVAADALGSTIVGTFGYMSFEQFQGAASPASDLYGLGGTLLFLLSGRPPSAFPIDRMRINFSAVEMSPRLGMVLEGLLEPLPEDRMPAEDALAILSGKPRPARRARQPAAASPAPPPPPPPARVTSPPEVPARQQQPAPVPSPPPVRAQSGPAQRIAAGLVALLRRVAKGVALLAFYSAALLILTVLAGFLLKYFFIFLFYFIRYMVMAMEWIYKALPFLRPF